MALLNCITRCTNYLRIGFIILSLIMENTQARIGYFWHITDLHLDTIYSTQGDVMRSCWRIERQPPSSSTHLPGRYGDYLCDSPWSLIESAARAMKSRQGDNVEFVLWTGDGLSHSAHPMSEMKKLEILRNITDLLGRTFSSQFVFPVLGHEDGTTTNFRHMGELWRHWLPTEALHTFEKGGYYSIEQTKSRLRIIALNTNFMRHDPKYSQSHLAAVRQRTPLNTMNTGGSMGPGGLSSDSTEYKNYYYHHNNMHQHHGHASDWSSSGHGYGYNSHHRGINVMPGGMHHNTNGMDGGGRVSALSEYETQDTEKQWIWLEDVLSKSKTNKETYCGMTEVPSAASSTGSNGAWEQTLPLPWIGTADGFSICRLNRQSLGYEVVEKKAAELVQVYIVGHIPPGSDERHIGLQQNGHTTFTESNNKRYLELVRKYSSIIQGQFFGHLHSDSFRIIYDDKGKPVSWMMISPSVTPRKMNVGSNNPAMRLYKFDTDSGQVLDYTQYYMDLQLANTLGEPNWVPEYNLTHYYALSDISAISLHNFVDRFTSNDGSWFAKYYRANTVRHQNENCEGVCMLNHYCAITRVDYKEFRQCLEKEQSALRSSARGQHGNNNITLIFSLMFTISLAYMQGIGELLCSFLRKIIRCRQLKIIQEHKICESLLRMRIKLMGILLLQYREIRQQKEIKNFDLLYNSQCLKSKMYLPSKQQELNCNHCLQRKPMKVFATRDTALQTDSVPEITWQENSNLRAQLKQKQRQMFVSHAKKLYATNNQICDLRLEYFKLIIILIFNSISVQYSKLILRLLCLYSNHLSKKEKSYYSTLALRSCSKILLRKRFLQQKLLHKVLI